MLAKFNHRLSDCNKFFFYRLPPTNNYFLFVQGITVSTLAAAAWSWCTWAVARRRTRTPASVSRWTPSRPWRCSCSTAPTSKASIFFSPASGPKEWNSTPQLLFVSSNFQFWKKKFVFLFLETIVNSISCTLPIPESILAYLSCNQSKNDNTCIS